MPKVCQLDGCAIYVNADDHFPAHFHVRAGGRGGLQACGWHGSRRRKDSGPMRYHLCSIRRMAAGDDRYWDAEVTSVEITHHWHLRLEFSDGYSGEVDVSYLRRKPGLFKDLRDPDYFARAFLDEEQGTVAWPNGMDVAAHVLRARADQQARRPPSARRKVRRRGAVAGATR